MARTSLAPFPIAALGLLAISTGCGDDGVGSGLGDGTQSGGIGQPTQGLPGGTASGSDQGPGPSDDTVDGTESSDGGGPPPLGVLAGDIAVDTIEFNQGVGINVVQGGAPLSAQQRVAPVIGGRPALVRASYTLADNFSPRTIIGRLSLRNGTTYSVYSALRDVSGPPDWNDFNGTFLWKIDADDLTDETEFQLQWLELDPTSPLMGDTSDSQFPAKDFAPLGAWGDRMVLDLVVVPFTCTNQPDLDLSPDNLADFEAFIYNTYPIQQLNLTLRESVHSDTCDEFGVAEAVLPDLRIGDGADPWVYYGGLMPGDRGGYSIAIQDSDQMDFRRTFASHTWRDFGLTFDLFAHELGHNHGRQHSFDDPSYPGSGGGGCGAISTYGWGPRSALMPSSGWGNDLDLGIEWFNPNETLLRPTDASCSGLSEGNRWNFNDIMSYQYPFWVSAHTYAATAERVRLISSWSGAQAPPEQGPVVRLILGPEGDVHRFEGVGRHGPVAAPDAWAQCESEAGSVRVAVRHGTSLRERVAADGHLRGFRYESYELAVPEGFDPSRCALKTEGNPIAFAVPR